MDEVTITVNLDLLTIGDLKVLDRIRTAAATDSEMVDFLNRVVEGGASQIPLTRFKDVMKAVSRAIGEAINPTYPTEEGEVSKN